MPFRSFLADQTHVMPSFMQVATVVAAGPTVGPLPLLAQSVQAWVTFTMALFAIAMVFWRGGKFQGKLEAQDEAQKIALANLNNRVEDRLDGFGGRVQRIEEEGTARRERDAAHLAAVNECTASLRELAVRVGAATSTSESCNEQTRNFAIEIGSKIDLLGRDMRSEINKLREDVHTDARKTGERLAGVEAMLPREVRGPYVEPRSPDRRS